MKRNPVARRLSRKPARLALVPGRIYFLGAVGLIVTFFVAAFAASSPAEEPPPPFLFAFGGEGSGAGEFNVARGVGMNLSNGDVYAADQGNERVQEFNPWGVFIGMFGKEVNETRDGAAGATEAEKDLCTQREVDEKGVKCKVGATGEGAGQFHTPEGVAVDNGESSTSRGDVYVVDFSNRRVEKFTPGGEFVLTFGKEVNETRDAVAGATEAEKNVCTAASGDHCKAGKAGTGEDEFEWTGGNYIAVGSTGTVYVGDENRVQEFEPTGQHLGQITLAGAGKVSALAVDASGDVYVNSAALKGVHEYNAAGELAEFDPASETVEAVALNPAGDLFVGERPNEKRVRIIEYSPTGAQLASFGSEGLGEDSASTGLAANESGTVYVAEHTAPYKVVVFGKPPPGEPPLVAPSIDSQSVTNLGVTDALVGAQINPHFLGTRYYVEYGTSTEYSLGKVPAPPGAVLSGGGVQGDQPASVTLSGLTPAMLYHFRFVAQSENEKGETRTTYGADQTFTTFASSGLSGLPDGRVYEQVSPLEANGNGAGGIARANEFNVGYGVAEREGNRVLYFQRGSFAETHSGYDVYSVSTRGPQTGWKTSAALPPGCGYNASNFSGEKPTALLPSADFSHLVFGAPGGFGAGNCLEPSAENPEALNRGLYRTAIGAEEPELWLTKPTITGEEEKNGQPGPTPDPIIEESQAVVGGSPNLQTVYFTFFGTLVPEDKTRAPHVDASPGTSAWGFYEWSEGALRSAGILPNEAGEPAPGEPDPYGAVPAATREERREQPFTPSELDNEVSMEGATAFFVSPDPKYAAKAGTPTELYAREQGDGGEDHSVLVSRDELAEGKPAPGTGDEEAVVPVNSSYMFASPDGSRVFFASKDRLTEAAPSGSAVKEYEFDLDTNELTYLPDFAEPASTPFSSILASSQDGSSFIFENAAAQKVELWERSPGGEEHVTEIATFSTPSSPTFEARAVKDGDRTAFLLRTNAVLSGDFNDGSATQQVYRYVTGGKLTCVSCAPVGTAQSEALGFRSARALVDEGARVFFTSAEQLLARAGNGVENVYEWEQGGTGSCESEEREGGCIYLISSGTSPNPSFLIDTSESGADVFFATTEGLVTGDTGESYAVYDARVDGGFPESAPTAECVSSCRAASLAPALAAPLSTALGPSGNLTPLLETPPPKPKPLTRAQRLAKALKACQKTPKRKRAACIKQADKRYGPQAKAKKAQPSRRRRS